MRSLSLKLFVLAGVLALAGISSPASAMPNFARKYNLGCATCHIGVPRLNEFGWKFRAAGYRLPDEIGKPIPNYNLGDYFAGRVNFGINYMSATAAASGSNTVNNFNMAFSGGSIYALFGALTKNVSSEAEIGFAADGTPSFSSASAGYYVGNEENWFSARIGKINIFQGYGGSDRGWSGSPLMNSGYSISIPSLEAGEKSPTYTGLTGSNMGIDLGYVFGNAAVHAEALSGYTYSGTSPSAAIAGKPTGTGAGEAPSANSLDYMLWANYILTEDGGGISAAYYMGSADLQTNGGKYSTVDSNYWTNKFGRYAVYASYPIQKALVLAGYEGGTDKSWTLKSFAFGPDISSHGFFGELDYLLTDLVGLGARYDNVIRDNSQTNNAVNVITGYVNYSFGDGLQLVASYAAKSTDTPDKSATGLLGTAKNNTFGLRISWFQ